MLSLDLDLDNREEKMVEQVVGEAGQVSIMVIMISRRDFNLSPSQVGRGDMACNGDWLVMGCEAGVAWAKVGQQLMQLNTEDVMQVGFSEHI